MSATKCEADGVDEIGLSLQFNPKRIFMALERWSQGRPLRLLTVLGWDVEIVFRKPKARHLERLSVAAA